MVCATTPTARIAPTFGMTDAMNGKEGRMTLFNKLAGKASALLNASGICSNNCADEAKKAPTIDPESLRPTAHWENEEDFNGDPVVWFCSACKERFFLYDGTPEENDYKYCPYCGARMVNADE